MVLLPVRLPKMVGELSIPLMVVWWLLTKVTGLVHIGKTQLISGSYKPPRASGKEVENVSPGQRTKAKN